jgi:hypothetical protein
MHYSQQPGGILRAATGKKNESNVVMTHNCGFIRLTQHTSRSTELTNASTHIHTQHTGDTPSFQAPAKAMLLLRRLGGRSSSLASPLSRRLLAAPPCRLSSSSSTTTTTAAAAAVSAPGLEMTSFFLPSRDGQHQLHVKRVCPSFPPFLPPSPPSLPPSLPPLMANPPTIHTDKKG